MPDALLAPETLARRRTWVAAIKAMSGNFGDDFDKVERDLSAELANESTTALTDHLRTCGTIPEEYGHDSSEEKLYSKYTDAVLAAAFVAAGTRAVVLRERADSADVEGVAEGYAFVADAKAFRLSRTAKNQKDFKVQAMDTWKRGKPFAIVVCPAYQLPASASQIYQQAAARDVCILTYSHIAALVEFARKVSPAAAAHALHEVLQSVSLLNPTKSAVTYWTQINRALLSSHDLLPRLWAVEKGALVASLASAKEEALTALAREREAILRLSHQEALSALVSRSRLVSREATVRSMATNGILDAA